MQKRKLRSDVREELAKIFHESSDDESFCGFSEKKIEGALVRWPISVCSLNFGYLHIPWCD